MAIQSGSSPPPLPFKSMLTLTTHEPNEGKCTVADLSTISDLIAQPETIVWLDGLDPTREEIDFLAEEFGFHPLAIDDYYTPHERPKVDEYPGYYFIVTQSRSSTIRSTTQVTSQRAVAVRRPELRRHPAPTADGLPPAIEHSWCQGVPQCRPTGSACCSTRYSTASSIRTSRSSTRWTSSWTRSRTRCWAASSHPSNGYSSSSGRC